MRDVRRADVHVSNDRRTNVLDTSGDGRINVRDRRIGVFAAALLCAVLAIAQTTAAFAGAAALRSQLVILDNDFRGPAGSDIQSVLPLLANPNVTVLGFTVVTGDDWENAEAAALLRFLEVAGRTGEPVVNGAVYPLVNTVAAWRIRERQFGIIPWKGAWGGLGSMDGVPSIEPPVPVMPQGAPATSASSETAAAFLIREVHAHPHAVTIVADGPLTNLALAIRLDPTFAGDTKALVLMGGIVDQDLAALTTDPALAEDFNFIFDPEAAHITLTAGWPHITDIGAVSGDVVFTRQLVDRIARKRTPVTRYLQTYFEQLPMWDEVTAAIAVDPALVTRSAEAYLDVDLLPGVDYGRAHLWPLALAPRDMGLRKVTVVEAFDEHRFIEDFVRAAQAAP